jgi:4'-phosphopantetheinyl transferase
VTDLAWHLPPPQPRLAPETVHVWRASLDRPEPEQGALGAALAPDEVARADRYLGAEVRGRFVVARGILRAILGR